MYFSTNDGGFDMQLKQTRKPTMAYAIAFGLPVISILILQIIAGCEPFSNQRSMLYSDMYHQYYPFFIEFRRALRSGDSLLYSWSVGMGMDYLALISYYLASPLNLISILLPESWMLEYFSLLMPLKLGLASLFFAIFLHKIYGDNDEFVGLFGAMYGLCAWALGYQWNIMWLDSFALLPLLALGTVSLLRDKKFILYTLTLFLSIFSNYYIGLFSCIFTLLLFFAYEICRWKGFKRFCMDFLRIGCFTVIAIGMTAVLELPALAGLQNTQSSVNAFPTGFRLNIASNNTIGGLFDAMRQVAGNTLGGLTPTFKEGLPNVYCGVGSLVLAFLYLTCLEIRLRDKIAALSMLVFFMLSFIIRQLDYIWHGMHFTNMIPYRFSFLFCFVVLYMAYNAWRMREKFNSWNLAFAGFATVFLIVISDGWKPLRSASGDTTDSWLFLAYNVGFLILYLLGLGFGMYRKPMIQKEDASEESVPEPDAEISEASAAPVATDSPEELLSIEEEFSLGELLAEPTESSADADYEMQRLFASKQARRKRLAALCMMGVLVAEIAVNVLNFGLRFSYTTVTNYPRGTTNTAAVIDFMKERESGNPFYRAETTHSQTLNDGALNDYHGVSTFTSSANVRVTEFMKALGYGAKNTYNRYCFEESSPVANLFLNLKYMIERDGEVEENDYFDLVFSSGNVSLLENNAYLPLGFLTHPMLADLSFSTNDHFAFQNDLFTAATGLQADVWHPVKQVKITADNVELTSSNATECSYTNAKSGSSVTYHFIAPENGLLCLDFDVTDRNNYEVFLNGTKLYSESLSLPQMIAASNVLPGDEITVTLKCDSGEEGNMNVKAAIVDGALFRTGLELLRQSPLEITSFSTTNIEGHIECVHDGLLYTSVPYDGNWQVYVDGVMVEPTLVGDAMIGVMVQEGPHDIHMTYHNEAFSYGWKISLGCAMVLLICIMAPRRKSGKFEK